jgi:predicted RNase H-like nuclease
MIAAALLERAEKLAGIRVSLVMVDMPMARTPILGRRVSDNAVSRAFGRMACGTHTPHSARPGAVSEQLRDGFLAEGYPLLTDRFSLPGLIEVYPHPALLALMQADYRLPYKLSKIRNYWPDCPALERKQRLIGEWERIVAALDRQIAGTADMLVPPPADSQSYVLKGFEDALDAVICAWIGICALDGHAEPFGNEESAIWIPKRRPPSAAA